MREEVKAFFDKRDLELDKLVKKNRQGLDVNQIAKAMEQVYDRVKCGEKIKPIRIGWEVWRMAKENAINKDLYAPTVQEMNSMKSSNEHLIEQVKEYKLGLIISLMVNIILTVAWWIIYGRAYL